MQPEPALDGTQRAVELNAVAAVHLHAAMIVHPGHTEDDCPLRLHQPLHQPRLFILGMTLDHRIQGR